MSKKKRIVIALGGNALGNTLPEQMAAVKITARAIVDLIEEGCEVVVAHGNGPQVGMINNAMLALTHEDEKQPNTPLSVCVAAFFFILQDNPGSITLPGLSCKLS